MEENVGRIRFNFLMVENIREETYEYSKMDLNCWKGKNPVRLTGSLRGVSPWNLLKRLQTKSWKREKNSCQRTQNKMFFFIPSVRSLCQIEKSYPSRLLFFRKQYCRSKGWKWILGGANFIHYVHSERSRRRRVWNAFLHGFESIDIAVDVASASGGQQAEEDNSFSSHHA